MLFSSLSVLSTLDLYYPAFAQALVESTQSYYHAEAQRLSGTLPPAEYIIHADSRIRLEDERCARFFERQSLTEVLEVVRDELITNVSQDIVDRGFHNLVQTNNLKCLCVLYSLLKTVKQVDIIRTAWSNYIKARLLGIKFDN